MSIDQPRSPAGSPAGGRFAGVDRPESSVELSDPGIDERDQELAIPFSELPPDAQDSLVSGWRARLREVGDELAAAEDLTARLRAEKERVTAHLERVGANNDGPTRYRGPGHVDDVVRTGDGRVFHRIRTGVAFDVPDAIRVQVDRELSTDEATRLAAATGYQYAKTGGERSNRFEHDAPNSIVLHVDSTKGRAYQNLDHFLDGFAQTIQDGSPVRKTDRSGPGTRGTRLVDGIGPARIELYSDSVTSN